MFSIVTELSTLQRLYRAESDWGKIARKTSRYYVKCDIDIREYPDLLNLDQAGYIDSNREDAIEAILNGDYSRVYDFPNSAFILNVDKCVADRIQSEYGVVFQSAQCPDSSILTDVDPDYKVSLRYVNSRDRDLSWGSILSGLVTPRMPSNSLIINDRYLFAKDKFNVNDDARGVDSVKEILRTLLPSDMVNGYYVVILFWLDGATKRETAEQLVKNVAEGINKIKKERQFKHMNGRLNIDVICLYGNNSGEKTHNRRIISNYYTITAEHKLYVRGESAIPQNFNVYKLFSHGIDGKSDSPLVGHADTIKGIRDVIDEALANKKSGETVFYAHNGNMKDYNLCEVMKNRLFVEEG